MLRFILIVVSVSYYAGAQVICVNSVNETEILDEEEASLPLEETPPPAEEDTLPVTCQICEEVDNTTLTFPPRFESVSVPWMRKDLKPRLVISAGLLRNWRRLTSQKVIGMSATIGEVIRYFEENNCLLLLWGAVIRDMILGQLSRGVEAAVSCNQERVHSLCSTKFGADNCEKAPTPASTQLRIGNGRRSVAEPNSVGPIDVIQWKDIFEVRHFFSFL